MRKFILFLVLFSTNSFALDHLVPPSCVMEEDFKAFQNLKQGDVAVRPVLQYAVRPAFKPQRILSIVKNKKTNRYSMSLTKRTQDEQSRWKESVDIEVVDESVVTELSKAFKTFVSATKYPAQSISGFDGTTYHFVTRFEGEGVRCGVSWNPEEGSAVYKLVDLSDTLLLKFDKKKADEFSKEFDSKLEAIKNLSNK